MKSIKILMLLIGIALFTNANAQQIKATNVATADLEKFPINIQQQIKYKVDINFDDFEQAISLTIDNQPFTLVYQRSKTNNLCETTHFYSNAANDKIMLRKKNKTLSGEFFVDGYSYNLINTDEAYFLFAERKAKAGTKECNLSAATSSTNFNQAKTANIDNDNTNALRDVGSNVRVLVIYTDDVAADYSDPVGEIKDAIERMNTGNSNSGVGHQVEIAAIEKVNYNEFEANGTTPKDKDDVFAELMDFSDGILDDINLWRDLYDADLVHFVPSQVVQAGDDWCGFAFHIGFANNPTNGSTNFCMTKMSCFDGSNDHTFTHEMGHLYGCRHDTYVDNNNSPYAYGHGFKNLSEGWRTIMSYADECSDNGSSCPRINYWSNPSVFYLGNTTGNAATADNERVMDNQYDEIVEIQATPNNKSVWNSDIVTADEVGHIKGNTTVTTVVNQPYTINNGGEAVFSASNQINLLPGFHARSGSKFSAVLQ